MQYKMRKILRRNIDISEGRSVFGCVFFLYNLVMVDDQALQEHKLLNIRANEH